MHANAHYAVDNSAYGYSMILRIVFQWECFIFVIYIFEWHIHNENVNLDVMTETR